LIGAGSTAGDAGAAITAVGVTGATFETGARLAAIF
jgi:hypothetical protein